MRNGGIQLRISDLLFAVQKRWQIIVALTIIGGVFGLLLSGMTYVQSSLTSYNISGSFVINTKNASGLYLYGEESASQNDFNISMDMASAVLYILRSERVIEDVLTKQELIGVSYRDVRNSISLSVYNGTQIVEMTLNWSNDEEGKNLWYALIDSCNEILPMVLQFGNLTVLNECTATIVGVGGSGKMMPVVLAFLGFAAGMGFAVMELLMHPTLNNIKDVETVFGLETIGLIPRDEAFFKKKGSILVEDENTSSDVQQNYSAAAYILRNRLGTKEGSHCFYVTSATNREGRTTVAANLAIQLSDMEHRTLLVDFDTRNPGLGSLFMNTVDYEHSLNALYRGEISEQDAITTLTGYLDILPTVLEHNPIPMDGMVMDLIKKLSERYEYVVLDAPPVGKESETLSLNQIATTVLFVVGYDTASIPEIQSALEKLDKSGIRVLGCIVNNVQGTRYRSITKKGDIKKRIQSNRKKKKKKDDQFPGTAEGGDNGVEDLLNKKGTKRKKKIREDKKRDRKRKQETAPVAAADPDSTEVQTPAPVAFKTTRNIMEELEEDKRADKPMNDQDTLAELYKMGLEGDWDKTDKKDDTPPAPPQS